MDEGPASPENLNIDRRATESFGFLLEDGLTETSFLVHAFIFSLCTPIVKGALKFSCSRQPPKSQFVTAQLKTVNTFKGKNGVTTDTFCGWQTGAANTESKSG